MMTGDIDSLSIIDDDVDGDASSQQQRQFHHESSSTSNSNIYECDNQHQQHQCNRNDSVVKSRLQNIRMLLLQQQKMLKKMNGSDDDYGDEKVIRRTLKVNDMHKKSNRKSGAYSVAAAAAAAADDDPLIVVTSSISIEPDIQSIEESSIKKKKKKKKKKTTSLNEYVTDPAEDVELEGGNHALNDDVESTTKMMSTVAIENTLPSHNTDTADIVGEEHNALNNDVGGNGTKNVIEKKKKRKKKRGMSIAASELDVDKAEVTRKSSATVGNDICHTVVLTTENKKKKKKKDTSNDTQDANAGAETGSVDLNTPEHKDSTTVGDTHTVPSANCDKKKKKRKKKESIATAE